VKCLVLQNLAEDAARRWVLPEDLLVDRESSSGSLLGEMEESEKRVFLSALDAKVVQAALSGREPIRFERLYVHPERRRGASNPPQDFAPAEAKELGMALLVLGVAQEEAAQKWIWGKLGGAREIATAVLFRLGETQQLLPTPGRVRPDPAVQGSEQPIEARRLNGHWHVIA
jgi:hypothetical protein